MSKLLFFDVDGVLNTRPESLDGDKVERLKRISLISGCQLVLHGSWRNNVSKVCQLGNAGLKFSSPGFLASISWLPDALIRETLILVGLHEKTMYEGKLEHFLILDDLPLPGLAQYQILIDPAEGLTEEKMNEVIDRFNEV